MQKMYYIVENGDSYEVIAPNQLEKKDKIIDYLPSCVWFDFRDSHDTYQYSHAELKKALGEYKKEWKEEHPNYPYYFE